MRVAVIGTGIAGNAAAGPCETLSHHRLRSRNQTGAAQPHRHIDYEGTPLSVDIGFIVYNE